MFKQSANARAELKKTSPTALAQIAEAVKIEKAYDSPTIGAAAASRSHHKKPKPPKGASPKSGIPAHVRGFQSPRKAPAPAKINPPLTAKEKAEMAAEIARAQAQAQLALMSIEERVVAAEEASARAKVLREKAEEKVAMAESLSGRTFPRSPVEIARLTLTLTLTR